MVAVRRKSGREDGFEIPNKYVCSVPVAAAQDLTGNDSSSVPVIRLTASSCGNSSTLC